MEQYIDSIHNKVIKEINALKNKKDREKRGLFILEGDRLISEIDENWKIEYVVVSKSYVGNIEKYDKVYIVSDDMFSKISDTVNPQGIMAVCYIKDFDVVEIDSNENPFYIILENVMDPGNMGTIIRTADAVGAHGVVIPKRRAVGLTAIVSKTSAGALEFVPVARVTNMARTIDELKKENIWVACADMAGREYFKSDLKGAIALVIGNEGSGVSDLVKKKCDFTVGIPMYGSIDSLNASVSAGLIMYEVVRQRKFN